MDDADTDAMARAMGFSSFGAQPNKRRKYNHRANEAVVATPSLPLHQPNGANAVPLGTRSRNQEEIMLDDDDDDNDEGNTLATCATAPAPAGTEGESPAAAGADGQDEDPEPQYIDTSRPSLPAADDVQSKIDSILGTGVGAQLPALDGPGSHGMGHRGRGGRQQGGKPWWEDYYDPTANMNPWEKLEKECDLAPTNAWLTWEDSKARWEEVKARGIESSAQA
jgi:hypothetical protein